MEIKLIAIDLDGTLLTSEKQITPDALDVIREAQAKKNVHVVVATARPPRSSIVFYQEMDLSTPMINYNGALVWLPKSGKILLHKPIPFGISRGIIRWAKQHYPGQIYVSANIGSRWYTDFGDTSQNFEALRNDQPDMVAPYHHWLTQAPTKLMLLGKPEALDETIKAVQKELPNQVSLYRANKKMLQIMHISASKRDALKRLTTAMNIPRESVMAIGDNLNDAGMIRWAGVGVSMANGHVVCLQIADHVTDHHDDDGVAQVLQTIVVDGNIPPGL